MGTEPDTPEKLTATDLAELDILEHGDEPQRLELIDPRNNQPVLGANKSPATFYVLSFECETMQRFQDEQINKSAKRGGVLTAEQQRERQTTIVARLLMAKPWENIDWKGAQLPFNLVNAKMLMTRLPWARRQVEALASQEAAYLGNSSPRSSSSENTTSGSASDQKGAA